MKDKHQRASYRQGRVRRQLAARTNGRPRLSVFRSLRHLYAQVIDDSTGRTLASASSLAEGVKTGGKNVASAKKVGESIAKKAVGAGVKAVVFDRGAQRYHGRIKALADAARASGLEF